MGDDFMNNFHTHLQELLKKNKKFVDKENKILRNVVTEAAKNLDAELLKILHDDEEAKKIFFAEFDNVTVFDKDKFVFAVNNSEFLPDSYTGFKNKIGLVDERGNFISTSGDVTLFFPYKDCLLVGGQTKDDQKRPEIFYHETLAHSEIDCLLAKKVFSNAKKFSSSGVDDVTNFSTTDNLIIKGNNLIALACLEKVFANKIKCIYIDVPYNTGNDSFGYNDRFNHSTWLTFMKNRLQLAKKLLTNDGSIWISIDDDEQAYLKILCDEIFGRDNFLSTIIWERAYAPVNLKKNFSKSHDYILVYAKNISQFVCNGLPRSIESDSRYKNPDNDPRGVWKSSDLSVGPIVDSKIYEITTPSGRKVFPPKGYCWRLDKETFQKYVEDNRIYFGENGNNVPSIKRFLSEVKQSITPMTIWKYEDVGHTDESKKEIKALNLSEVFATPKPERLIQRILTLATNEGDIVLDNFLGSGTTAAVAHKMNRQYIGVEQMNYIETVTVERLKKVIGGEQGGISKAVDWQGGGSFIYCELAKLNEKFVDEIATAQDIETILALYKKIAHSDFISYKVEPKEFEKNISDFEELSLENQKKLLIAILDKNMLYVNYSDIDDEDFNISDADKKFTHSFYGD